MVSVGKPHVDSSQPPQSVPYGIARVGYADYTGTHLAWIIDTGIDFGHPDLNVNTTLAKTFVIKLTQLTMITDMEHIVPVLLPQKIMILELLALQQTLLLFL